MKVTVAILWTIILILHILIMSDGGQPTWLNIILPLIYIIINAWTDVIEDRR